MLNFPVIYKVFKDEYYETGQDCMDIENLPEIEKITVYELRRKILLGLSWTLLEPEKDRVTSIEGLDRRIEEIKKKLTEEGKEFEFDLTECLDEL